MGIGAAMRWPKAGKKAWHIPGIAAEAVTVDMPMPSRARRNCPVPSATVALKKEE